MLDIAPIDPPWEVESAAPSALVPPVEVKPRTQRRKLYNRTCPECCVDFKAGRDSMFCTAACKDRWHNRNAKRGKVAVPFLLAWRTGYGKDPVSKYAYQQLSELARQWNLEDKAAGRRSATAFVARKMREGWRAADLEPGA